MTDEELGALLLRKARPETRIVTLNAEIKAASGSLLKLADTLASNPGDLQFKNLPGKSGSGPSGWGGGRSLSGRRWIRRWLCGA